VGFDFEPASYPSDVVDRYIAFGPLDPAEIGAIDAALMGQGFLAKTTLRSKAAHISRQHVPQGSFVSLFHKADFGPLPLLRRPLLSYIRARHRQFADAPAFAVGNVVKTSTTPAAVDGISLPVHGGGAGAEPENPENMRMRGLMIVGALTMLSLASAKAAEDLSGFGIPVDGQRAQATSRGGWTADVCAEIQRVEKMVSEDARPIDRGMLRYGLLHLEMKHCGIDISKKLAADQAALEEIRRQSGREFDENMAAAQREASRPPQPIIVQVPQGSSGQSSLPDPSPPVNCLTTRLGGGMSTTSCR